MRVALGKFACSGIEAQMGPDLSAGVHRALRHYVARLESGWLPPKYPDFLRFSSSPNPATADLELQLDAEAQATLQREGLRNGTPIEQIAAHAVLVYLAYLDEVAGTNYV
jgi:hypothetical protein